MVFFAISLSDNPDCPVWKLGKNGKFSVKSIYDSLCNQHESINNSFIWKAKVPLKIKIFMWLLENNNILTKDNLIRRNWKGDKFCAFCNEEETIDHLFSNAM